ncbi:MAG: efflux RND transporter periplasmic adaptor subunit [Patescibacteria group bacterium]
MKNLLKKPLFILFAIILIIVVGSILVFSGRGGDKGYTSEIVKIGDVIQEVSATGRVKPAETVDLAFEKTGRISAVYVSVGKKVSKGQLLVQQSNADTLAQLESVEATLKSERAKLDEMKKGSRPEEIQIQEVKVANAKTSLADAKQNLIDKLNDSYTKADDSIRTYADQLFNNPRTINPQLNVTVADVQLEGDLEWSRLLLESMFATWRAELSLLSKDSSFNTYISTAKSNLGGIKSFLDDMAVAVNSLTTGADITQTTIDGYKSNISAARTNTNTAIVNLSSAEEGFRAAESSLSLEEQNLVLKLAGNTPEQIASQEAQVEKAQADVRKYEAELAKTVMRSPINGVVSAQEAKVGEIVSANSVMVSVISESEFEVESDIPEVDVAKIEVGDIAKTTLDAYGEDLIFEAFVVSVDPAETIIEGVPSYTTTFQFKEKDGRIRSGMTVNIDIVTDKSEGVLVIPQRAVVTRNGNKFVRVVVDDKIQEKMVEVGLRGSFGEVEIIEGLEEGDEIVTFVNN